MNLKTVIVKASLLLNERKYTLNNGKNIKYILDKNKSDKLVVIFSGFPSEKESARYNYRRTLKNINFNKLFILDDFGYENRGSYYICENNDFFVEDGVISLINRVKKELDIKETIFLGSSKGGYASLYFGIKYGAEYIISGAPQYYIGDHLNTEKHKEILKSIVGNITSNNINYLNNLLRNEITTSINRPKIYIHYSKKEHTYKEHIYNLVEDLKTNNYYLEEDIKDYELHSDVAKFFPTYINNVFTQIKRDF